MEDRIKILLFLVIFIGRMLHYGWIFLCAKCPVVLLDHIAWGAIIDIWFLFVFIACFSDLRRFTSFWRCFRRFLSGISGARHCLGGSWQRL